jgi:ribonucleoside-diphosphate reductase beta chain
VLLAEYDHFLEVAARRRWEERQIELGRDAESWPSLPAAERDRLLRLLAGFCVGERAVADQLEPFALAASDRARAACFRAQAMDEARHARFFDRVAAEVAGVPGGTPQRRRAALRPLAGEGLCELFELELPAVARRLGSGDDGLADAVGLYHMVLEGVVFSAGQLAMLDLLAGRGLPGLRRGLELVIGDERWHLGFGARVLQDLGLSDAGLNRILREGEGALACWGDAIGSELGERMLVLHRRRLRAAGLAPPRRPPDAAGGGQSAAPRSSGPPRTPLATLTSKNSREGWSTIRSANFAT